MSENQWKEPQSPNKKTFIDPDDFGKANGKLKEITGADLKSLVTRISDNGQELPYPQAVFIAGENPELPAQEALKLHEVEKIKIKSEDLGRQITAAAIRQAEAGLDAPEAINTAVAEESGIDLKGLAGALGGLGSYAGLMDDPDSEKFLG